MGVDALAILAAVGTAAEFGFAIYQKGFSKAANAHQQYIDFGISIKGLAQNLRNVEGIIRNANEGLRSHSLRKPVWDLEELEDIVGDYEKTLRECDGLLSRESSFQKRHGFVYNIMWNVRIEPEIARLKDSITFHKLKIQNVLGPLEIKLLSELRDLVQDLHQETMDELGAIRVDIRTILSRTMFEGESGTENAGAAMITIEVPDGVASRFQAALLDRHPECSDLTLFPLQDGMDAFIEHFQKAQGTSALDTTPYLNLLKSIWIMDRIKSSSHYHTLPPGSLWERYVKRMDRNLSQECRRLNSLLTPIPDQSAVLQLPLADFQILREDHYADHLPTTTYIEELFCCPLPTKDKRATRNLRVLRNHDGTLQIEDVFFMRKGQETTNDITRFHVSLERAHLVPLYASPGSEAWGVILRSDRNSANYITVTFPEREQLLRFQQLFTGYKTASHRKNVKVDSLISRFRSDIKTQERGLLQIWVRKPYEAPTTRDITTPDITTNGAVELPADTLSITVASDSSHSPTRKLPASPARSPTLPSSVFYGSNGARGGRNSIVSLYPTSIGPETTSGSVTSTLFSGTSETLSPINAGPSTTAMLLLKPEPPLLVLFLGSTTATALSFLTVTLTEATFINTSACKCRHRGSSCTVAVIEARGTSLDAQRHIAQDGLENWNLGAIGAFQKPSMPQERDAVQVKNLRWLKLEFPSLEEKNKFQSNFANAQTVYAGKLREYHTALKEIPYQHF